MRILIVGAGPTGLTAAVELARRGVIPTVVDRRDGPSPLSRAVGITPRSLSILAASGAAEAILAEGVAMKTARVYDGDRLALSLPLISPNTNWPHLVALPQDRTERALLDALARHGGAARYGLALEAAEDRGGEALVRFADGSEAVFDHIVGADGVRSVVRAAAGIEFPGIDLAEDWSIADVDAEGWRHPDDFTVFRGPPGEVAVVAPLGRGRFRVIANRPDALAALPVPMEVTNLRRAGRFTISVRQAEVYSKGRLHVAGDAAHCHSPVAGRGMNLGIADAAELARRLVEGGVDGYSALRHAEGRATIAATERGRKLLTAPDGLRRALVSGLLATADRIGPLKRRIGRFAVEL